MSGAHTEPDPTPRPHQPAHVLAAWVQAQLGDIRTGQVRRLQQLCPQLQTSVPGWDGAPLAQALSALHSAGRALQFAALRPGWVTRLLGHHRAARARFIAAYERIVAGASGIKGELAQLVGGHADRAAGARRLLLEIDIELQSLDAAIDEGVLWLQGMCTQLAEARAQGRDEPALEPLAEAAQRFTQEFRWLESVRARVHDIVVRRQGIVDRRLALLARVRVDMEGFDQAWQHRVGDVVAGLRSGRAVAPQLAKAAEAHDELMKRVSASVDACGALQQEEELLAQHLGLLQQQLRDGESTDSRVDGP